jgi:hypothetical protein
MQTVMWITIALLTPLWWAAGLLLLAVLGDLSPRWHSRVSALFDRIEGRRGEPARGAKTVHRALVS